MDSSAEIPIDRRNCCYDRTGQGQTEQYGGKPDGNAVGMAAAMGIGLLTQGDYEFLQNRGTFDLRNRCWLKTPAEIRKNGRAFVANRTPRGVKVGTGFPFDCGSNLGFRGVLRIKSEI